MGWLSIAIWELCMSMLPHRNTRALLVPVLCIALLVPFAAATAADARMHEDSTPTTATASLAVLTQQTPAGEAVYKKPRSRGLVFLGRDTSGIVPRKFTIPEPSVVADAEHKHIAMLPSRPYEAVAYEHRLLRRSMLERSGVSLADTMVVVTVDGRMYGVSRYDGSIVWSRECLFESAESTCPRSLVRTKGRAGGALEGGAQSGDRESRDPDAEDDDDEEEEWLLEQGIDWRSDPQVLERQRQLRREWLNKQRAARNSGGTNPPANHTSSSHARADNHEPLYIAEPGGGGTLYMYSADSGLKRLPLTIANLVDQSPVQVHGVLYTGNKEASFAAVDASTGRLLNVYGDKHTRTSGHSTSARFGTKRPPIRLLLSEKLDRVRIYPASDRASSYSQAPQWELYHRSVSAPTLDPEVDSILSELSDAVEALGPHAAPSADDDSSGDSTAEAASHGPTKFVMTQDGGFVMLEATTGIPLWAQEFDSPVVSVFDIYGIANPESESDSVEYVARKRELSPAAQQRRYLRWRQLHETDDEVLAREHIGFAYGADGSWRTGSSGGNILAGPFWERSSKRESLPQIAYIGKLKDTLYALTGDEFPLIDHASLTSSLLLALVQAKRHQDRYPEMQTAEWWNRWNFLTHDAVVLRVLQEARAWWLKPAAASNDLALENHFERLMDIVKGVGQEDRQMCEADNRCHYSTIIGIHPIERQQPTAVPEIEGKPLHRLALPDREMAAAGYGTEDDGDGEADSNHATAQAREEPEEWPWWRYVGHYMTR
ncbi:bifunctional endoribonuclease/protein kinase ire1, partial [Coemansia sp. RSA 2704]